MRAMLRLFSRRPQWTLQTRPEEELLWTSEIRILSGAFLRTNRLQVLIAHLAEAEPKFLDRLQQIFTKHHTLGADEQDYTDTAAYAEQFIHQVARLRDKERRG